MLVGCKNCGGYFTSDELQRQKPPAYPWALTAAGARYSAANAERGIHVPCPTCGQNALGGASPRVVQHTK